MAAHQPVAQAAQRRPGSTFLSLPGSAARRPPGERAAQARVRSSEVTSSGAPATVRASQTAARSGRSRVAGCPAKLGQHGAPARALQPSLVMSGARPAFIRPAFRLRQLSHGLRSAHPRGTSTAAMAAPVCLGGVTVSAAAVHPSMRALCSASRAARTSATVSLICCRAVFALPILAREVSRSVLGLWLFAARPLIRSCSWAGTSPSWRFVFVIFPSLCGGPPRVQLRGRLP